VRAPIKAVVPPALLPRVDKVHKKQLSSALPGNKEGASRNAAIGEIADARRLYAGGEYKAALGACDRALGHDPGNADAIQLRANIVQTMGILGIQ